MICAAAALLGLAGSAAARPACVFQDAALRGDAGSGEHLIGVIPALSPIVLVRQGPKWSIVSFDGETGYVQTRHLTPFGGPADPPSWRQSPSPNQTLLREIDPLFGDSALRLARGSALGFYNYFSGFRRSAWTDRTGARVAEARASENPCLAALRQAERYVATKPSRRAN
ncbi:hypothetical protein IY145_18690 [Methylosinus sp. H3A]|uniref:hypothetical protein n=1 Tax=Methylosinus sp. H3A TaxID=2785786 RepID=UPI0018C23AAC|nr:hypothetical protein [Methylosinus sp. H3A]MBG0811381.1 hypothetical protein [Methylosinus sp. H3A]